jgi:hypothetical protein
MALEGTIIMSDDLKDILDNMYDARYKIASTNTTNDLLSYSFLQFLLIHSIFQDDDGKADLEIRTERKISNILILEEFLKKIFCE